MGRHRGFGGPYRCRELLSVLQHSAGSVRRSRRYATGSKADARFGAEHENDLQGRNLYAQLPAGWESAREDTEVDGSYARRLLGRHRAASGVHPADPGDVHVHHDGWKVDV